MAATQPRPLSRVDTPEHRLVRLPNGVRVVTAPMRERASVSIALMFGVGSRYEEPERSGLAHFLEHMVFKGGRRYPTSRAVSEAIEGVGGGINAATDREMTMFWAKVPHGRLELAASVLTDMVGAPILDPDELAKERLVVVEELKMYEDNPQDHVHTLFDEVLFGGHALGRDVAGTEETVTSFEQAGCRRFLDEHYRADRLVVSVTGAIDHDEALETVSGLLSDWTAGTPARYEAAPSLHGASQLRFLNKRTEQANIVVGAGAVSYTDDERYVADILNTVLGEGMSSRLFLEVRERQALAYDVHSFTEKLHDAGALAMYIGCEPKRAIEALKAAVGELERLATERVPETELLKAREYSKGRLQLQLESTSALCNYLGQQELLVDEIITPNAIMDQLEAVTAEQVQSLAGRILDNGLRAAVVGPFRKPERFEEVLARTAPVTA